LLSPSCESLSLPKLNYRSITSLQVKGNICNARLTYSYDLRLEVKRSYFSYEMLTKISRLIKKFLYYLKLNYKVIENQCKSWIDIIIWYLFSRKVKFWVLCKTFFCEIFLFEKKLFIICHNIICAQFESLFLFLNIKKWS
jgi:hypothetical protein